MPQLLDSYRRAQGKFALPHFEKLQLVFQLDIGEECDLHEIRGEISNKLFDFTERVIEPLLWSHHHYHMIEREMVTKEDMERLFELYKEIQSLRWRNNLLTIKPDEEGTAQWINDLWLFWKRFEELTGGLCMKFSDGWKNLRFKEATTEYQG